MAQWLGIWTYAPSRASSIPTIVTFFLFQKQSDANMKIYFRVS